MQTLATPIGGHVYESGGRSESTEMRAHWLLDVFWGFFFICLVRPTVIPDLNMPASAMADLIMIYAISKSPQVYLELIRRTWILLTWPLLAMISTVWSYAPDYSLFHSVQFTLSYFVALVFIRSTGLERLCRIIFFANLLLQFITFGMSFGGGAYYDHLGNLRGLYLHKNELGFFTSLQVMVGCILFLHGWRRRLTGAGVLLALYLLVKSGSGTSLILTSLVIALFPILLLFRRGPATAGATAGLGVAAVSAGFLALVTYNLDPIDTVLGLLNKDSGLTGRDVVWALGWEAFQDNPYLGHGYLAYWHSTKTSVEYLHFVLQQNLEAFHDVYLETLVSFGVVGLTLFVFGLLQQLWRALRYLTKEGTILSVLPMLYLVWICVMCITENPLFWHSHFQLLLVVLSTATLMPSKKSQ